MKKLDVVIALETVKEARAKWAVAQTSFTADVSTVMKRLLNEAAVNMMSAEEVAKASGLTVKRVRALMRENNLNPKNSKRLLAKTAAETLAENAALMGVEPREFDLMSPLAYLPMGSSLKGFLGNSVTGEEVEAEASRLADEQAAWDKYVAENNIQPGSNDAYAFMCGYRAAQGQPSMIEQGANA